MFLHIQAFLIECFLPVNLSFLKDEFFLCNSQQFYGWLFVQFNSREQVFQRNMGKHYLLSPNIFLKSSYPSLWIEAEYFFFKYWSGLKVNLMHAFENLMREATTLNLSLCFQWHLCLCFQSTQTYLFWRVVCRKTSAVYCILNILAGTTRNFTFWSLCLPRFSSCFIWYTNTASYWTDGLYKGSKL